MHYSRGRSQAAAAKEEAQRNQGAATVEDLFAAIENQQKKCLKNHCEVRHAWINGSIDQRSQSHQK